jgi:hypothetical protein
VAVMETKELIKVAYKKYKQSVYFEQLNLFQKKELADFESSDDFQDRLDKIALMIENLQKDSQNGIKLFDSYIEKIGYNLLPKTVKTKEDKLREEIKRNENGKNPDEHFLTNQKSSDEYYLEGVNFFIDAPIELHLVCVIWVMKAGVILDRELSDSCFGSRLNESLFNKDDRSSHLFKIYNSQYQKWRNDALTTAERILEEDKQDVAILSLDFKQCFYCINTDFKKIREVLEKRINPEKERNFAIKLTNILEKIHQRYKNKIRPLFYHSHEHIPNHVLPLPVGLASSSLLCNWHLKELDKKIEKVVKPEYYGRYVDDILIVMKNPPITSENKIENFMDITFCKTKILEFDKTKGSYFLVNDKMMQIQEKKLILHFFLADHSHALLDDFIKKIEDNASAFFLLPDDNLQYYINKTAYNILFDGSTNKWRNIIGIIENVTELSKNLTNIITGLTQSKIQKEDLIKISDQLFKFYKGKNFVSFCRTWEKIFSFTILTNQESEGAVFFYDVQETILKISKFFPETDNKMHECQLGNNPIAHQKILRKLKADLSQYLLLSISIPVGLLGADEKTYLDKHETECYFRYSFSKDPRTDSKNISNYAKKIRNSNLIRHNYIAYPLINYTNYESSLINWDRFEEKFTQKSYKFISKKLEFTPRFIHFDEYYLFQFLKHVLHGDNIDFESLEKKYNEISHVYSNFPISIRKNHELSFKDYHENIEVIEHCVPKKYSMLDKRPSGKIKVGIANIKICDDDYNRSYYNGAVPNLSFKRQQELFSILNQAKKRNCDLLVLPESSVPYRWLPFFVKYARNHQMALIFGMEYWIVKKNMNIANNFIVSALPVKNKEKYKTCCLSIRCKNHYAPIEIEHLKEQNLIIPEIKNSRYDLFKWRGCQFSIYNCYEVSDIKHRAIFRSELDLLVACVLNKDTNYFSSIVESVVKDLHCYVVQVNCSEFGDSRVVQPTKTEQLNILRVSGGDDPTVLTAELDIQKLREFQLLDYPEQLHHDDNDKKFKPNPPGFDKNKIKKRGLCNRNK